MHLTATPCPQAEWPAAIAAVFRDDTLLLNYYHVAAPCALASAVADSYCALKENAAPDFVLYALRERGHLVGMIGVELESNCLVTFGLNRSHRTAEGVTALSLKIRTLLNVRQPIYCLLYKRNQPARKFLRRMGFTPSHAPLTHPTTRQTVFLYTLYPATRCPQVDSQP
jgi:hypothetical protein